MIIISGTIALKPGARDEAIEAINTVVAKTLAEPGCRAYRFGFEVTEPDTISVYEEWEDEDALASHFQQPHLAEFMAGIGAFAARGGSLTKFTVSDAQVLMG